jgi:hypothetical protein
MLPPPAQIFGNLSVWASFPAFVLYYLFYSSFEFNDPEGRVTDTTVRIKLKKKKNGLIQFNNYVISSVSISSEVRIKFKKKMFNSISTVKQ